MTEGLKDCPFCGGKVHYWMLAYAEKEPVNGVFCNRCHMFVKYSDLPKFTGKITIGDIQRAVANRWNRREG